MPKEHFTKAYVLGAYHMGQQFGEYLYDIPLESYDGDMSLIWDAAENNYKLYVEGKKLNQI